METAITERDHAILDLVEKSLAEGLEVYRWWVQASRDRDYDETFALLRQPRGDGSSYGFLHNLKVAGAPLPIVGTVQSLLCAPAVDPDEERNRGCALVERRKREVREFMMRYFMQVASFAEPTRIPVDSNTTGSTLQDLGQGILAAAVRSNSLLETAYEISPLSWSGNVPSRREGWGYSQLYYKRREDGRIGKFSASERRVVGDVREVGKNGSASKYEWIVLRVRIYDFPISFPPFTAGSQLAIPFRQDAYVVLSPEFVVCDDQPDDPDMEGRYGWGYAFIKLPPDGNLLAYGPVGLGPGFMNFRFDVMKSGEVLLYNAFTANQPTRLVNVPLNPVNVGIQLADQISLGLASKLFAPVRAGMNLLPFANASFDPVFVSLDLANWMTFGLAKTRFGISKEQLIKEVMAIHFMDCFRLCQGIARSMNEVTCWSEPDRLPAWVGQPRWLDTEEYPFKPNYLDVGPGRLHYVDQGEGEPVVMVHGNPDWSFSYRDLIKSLRDHYRCIAPDHIGFGLSDKPAGWDYLPKSHSENFTRFVQRLGLRNITLVVNDWGGPIGLSYALQHSENVKRLVIMNTSMWSVNDDWYYRLFSSLLGGPIGRFLISRHNILARFLLPALLKNPTKKTRLVLKNFSEATHNPEERKGQWVFPKQIIGSGRWLDEQFSQIQKLREVPALLIWGMQDAALREHEYKRWQEVLPKSNLIKFENASHYPHEDDAPAVAAAVRQFLEANP